jgi:hypothetical protein
MQKDLTRSAVTDRISAKIFFQKRIQISRNIKPIESLIMNPAGAG